MSKEKTLKTLTIIDNAEYCFSKSAFRHICHEYVYIKKKTSKYTINMLKEEIAEEVSMSYETVRQWYKENGNGPSDIEIVKQIAGFFDIDYIELLHQRGNVTMADTGYANTQAESEKEFILRFYQEIVDVVYFETGRFNNSDLDDNAIFENELRNKHICLYKLIDKNGLIISEKTKTLLNNTVNEIRNSRSNMEIANGRWMRVNPLHYIAREFFDEGCYSDESKEEEFDGLLYGDVFGTMETQYCAEIKGDCTVITGLTKDKTPKDVLKLAGSKVSEIDVSIYPSEDKLTYLYGYDEIYRYEYIKTIIAIFKEDFPEYF